MMTLVNVNDAYTVLATPSTCSIKADFNGANPVLDDACCEITVVRGDVKVPFSIKSVTPSNNGIQYAIDGTDATKRLKLNAIPIDVVTGTVSVEVETEDEFTSTIIFQYSVMRESTMLDWIEDWEGNKTVLGGNYILTPKIYAGSVAEVDGVVVLTGVYMGPDTKGAGLYGYNNGELIFQLNSDGGMIGGWDITETGMVSASGQMNIDSNGSIVGKDEDGEIVWGLYESGNAIFAGGNVKFFADGSAEYAGKITASEGEIAGWNLVDDYLYNDHIMLHGKNAYIGISLGAINENISNDSDHRALITEKGGVAMFYQSVHLFGLICHDSLGQNVFSIGSTNQIAGWSFDNEAIYIGTKNNMGGGFADTDSMTIGTNGLRGESWYLDKSGNFNLGCGTLTYDGTSVSLVGWTLTANRISNKRIAIISSDDSGIYISNTDLTNVGTTSLKTTIESNSGMYLRSANGDINVSGYIDGETVFRISTSYGCKIASWEFDKDNLYLTNSTISDNYAAKDSMVINANGMHGSSWYILTDGSGKFANGNISWNKNGELTISAKINILEGSTGVDNIEGIITSTTIEDGLITTGSIHLADNSNTVKAGITGGGTANSAVRIWAGSTYANRANAPFRVTHEGDLYASKATIEGSIIATSGKIGSFNISDGILKISDTWNMSNNRTVKFSTKMQADQYNVSSTLTTSAYTGTEYVDILATTEYGDVGLVNIGCEKIGVTGADSLDRPVCLDITAKVSRAPSHRYNHAYAIRANSGEFAGLRPAIRRIESSTPVSTSDFELSNLDYVIVYRLNQDQILKLPGNPEIGQTYKIIKDTSCASKTLGVNPLNSIKIQEHDYFRDTEYCKVNVFAAGYAGIKEYIYDGLTWHGFTISVVDTNVAPNDDYNSD